MFTYIIYRIFKKNREVYPFYNRVPHYNKFAYYTMGVIADIILVIFLVIIFMITSSVCPWKCS